MTTVQIDPAQFGSFMAAAALAVLCLAALVVGSWRR